MRIGNYHQFPYQAYAHLLLTPGADRKEAPAPTEWIALVTIVSGSQGVYLRQTPFAHGSRLSRLGAHAPIRSQRGVKWF
jgi:hypothetical protein